eukprot:453376-Prymnesium_polylepis.1
MRWWDGGLGSAVCMPLKHAGRGAGCGHVPRLGDSIRARPRSTAVHEKRLFRIGGHPNGAGLSAEPSGAKLSDAREPGPR